MAKKYLYCVYDSKVGIFHAPMVMLNKGEALRSWEEVANDDTKAICRHPQDFTLFEVGTFEDTLPEINMYKAPESLGLASNFKRLPQVGNQPQLFDTKLQERA